MKKDYLLSVIYASVETGAKVKVYFKEGYDRLPSIGWFIKLNDYESLSCKSLFRFVTVQNKDSFDVNKAPGFSKLYNIDSLTFISIVNEKK